MRKSWKAWCGAAALLLTLPIAAQQTVKEAEKDTADKSAFRKLVRPDDKFEILNRFVGTWEGTFKVMLHGEPPVEATFKDKLETKWVLGDSFIDTQFDGAFGTNVMRGRATMGYNGGKKHFYGIYLGEW